MIVSNPSWCFNMGEFLFSLSGGLSPVGSSGHLQGENIQLYNLLNSPQILRMALSGFPATLEIRENLENECPIFQSGKTQGIFEKHQKSGKTQGI